MNILEKLKKLWSPPIFNDQDFVDPDFGTFYFQDDYWECEWKFPPTGEVIFVPLAGDENGPFPHVREIYLTLPDRIGKYMEMARQPLEAAFQRLQRKIPEDVYSELKFVGWEALDLQLEPERWKISFETTKDRWYGISIPFNKGVALEPEIDS
ncbi:MAG: hypothetical protein ACO1QB_05055 [Verrucomicrobiales bacterium]